MSDDDLVKQEVDEYFQKNFGYSPKPAASASAASAPAPRASEPRAKVPSEIDSAPSNADIYSRLAEAHKDIKPGREPLTSFVTSPEAEKIGAGAAGAYVGSKVAPALRKNVPPKAERLQAGVKALLEQQRQQEALRALRDAQMLRMGITPPSAPPSGMSDIEHIMQSGRGEPRSAVTGRQMEAGHNWETQRQSLETKQRLRSPGAARQLIEAGPMMPTTEGIAIPKSVAAEMQAAQAARAAAAVPQAEAMLGQQLRAATPGALSQVGRALTGAKATGALGGLGAGLSAYETAQRLKEGDKMGAGISALSGAGGLMMMAPFPGALPLGVLMQTPELLRAIANERELSQISEYPMP